MTSRVEKYYVYARKIAWTFIKERKIYDTEEVVGDAMIGLCKADKTYQEDKGASFESWARKWILGAILDGMRDRDHLTRDDRQKVKSGAEEDVKIISLEHTVSPLGRYAEDKTVGDTVPTDEPNPEEQLMEKEEQREWEEFQLHFKEAIDALPERERLIVKTTIEDGWGANKALAEELNVSIGRITQLKSRAFEQIRTYIEEKEAA